MKEDEIIEGNKLIAEFMGYKRIGNSTWEYQYWTNGSRSYHDDTIKYNTSWDWLMEVVEKIETSTLEFPCQVIVDRMRKLDPNIEIKRNGKKYAF